MLRGAGDCPTAAFKWPQLPGFLGVTGRFSHPARLTPYPASVREPAHPAWGFSAPVVF